MCNYNIIFNKINIKELFIRKFIRKYIRKYSITNLVIIEDA